MLASGSTRRPQRASRHHHRHHHPAGLQASTSEATTSGGTVTRIIIIITRRWVQLAARQSLSGDLRQRHGTARQWLGRTGAPPPRANGSSMYARDRAHAGCTMPGCQCEATPNATGRDGGLANIRRPTSLRTGSITHWPTNHGWTTRKEPRTGALRMATATEVPAIPLAPIYHHPRTIPRPAKRAAKRHKTTDHLERQRD